MSAAFSFADTMPAMNQTNPVTVAIAGAAGRMGQRLCALACETPGVALAEAFERPGHDRLGRPAVEGRPQPAIADQYLGQADVLIDFTTPAATRDLIARCVDHRKAIVIGTTGLTDSDHDLIDTAAKHIPIVQAPNMSLGVNLLFDLVARAAKQLGDDYDIEILEAHHRFKKDAPSGTAMGIAHAICDATGKDKTADLIYARHGHDAPRQPGKITMQTLRMGDVVGEHTVYFASLGERLELRHVATTRDTFAHGALRAAQWLKGRVPGRYNMADVLGLR